MVDLTTRTIKNLFERQVQELTRKTLFSPEDTLDIQFSGDFQFSRGWFS